MDEVDYGFEAPKAGPSSKVPPYYEDLEVKLPQSEFACDLEFLHA